MKESVQVARTATTTATMTTAGAAPTRATRRFSAVRWGVSRNMVMAWMLTFPVCGAIAWLVAKVALAVFS